MIVRLFIRELKDKVVSFLMPPLEDVVSLCDVSKFKYEFALELANSLLKFFCVFLIRVLVCWSNAEVIAEGSANFLAIHFCNRGIRLGCSS